MKEIKILLLGEKKSGKSKLIERYLYGYNKRNYSKTLFETYQTTVEYDNSKYIIRIRDIGGSENMDRFKNIAYLDTDVFVICIDVQKELDRTKQILDRLSTRKPIVGCLTKTDLASKLNFREIDDMFYKYGIDVCVKTSIHDKKSLDNLIFKVIEVYNSNKISRKWICC